MNPGQAWRTMLRDHAKTESPNAGWTMSAMASALEVSLVKAGHYRLGDGGHVLTPDTIDRALKLMLATALTGSAAVITAEVVYYALT